MKNFRSFIDQADQACILPLKALVRSPVRQANIPTTIGQIEIQPLPPQHLYLQA
jgi:hypothetical protein